MDSNTFIFNETGNSINISITTHCISYTDMVMMKLDHTQHEKKRLYKNDYSRNEERISYSLLVGGSGLQ